MIQRFARGLKLLSRASRSSRAASVRYTPVSPSANRLAGIAEQIRAEGWAWVEAAAAATYADLQAFQRAPQEKRQPNAREAKRIAKLNEKAQAVETALQAAIDAEDEDKADALHDEGYRLSEQLNDLDTHLMTYSPTVRAAAGAVVTIDQQGEAASATKKPRARLGRSRI